MKNVFFAIQNKLLPLLPYVDEDWGQLTDYGANMPLKFPCCLIDLNEMNFENLGTDRTANPVNRQTGTGTIRLTVATQKLTNSSGLASINQKNNAFSIWDIIEQVHQLLHGWKPVANGGALMRVRYRKVKRDDGAQVVELYYAFSMANV